MRTRRAGCYGRHPPTGCTKITISWFVFITEWYKVCCILINCCVLVFGIPFWNQYICNAVFFKSVSYKFPFVCYLWSKPCFFAEMRLYYCVIRWGRVNFPKFAKVMEKPEKRQKTGFCPHSHSGGALLFIGLFSIVLCLIDYHSNVWICRALQKTSKFC